MVFDVFYEYLAASERPLQRVPRQRRVKKVFRLERQVSAVGAVESARPYHSVVGGHGSHAGAIFYPSEQVVVAGVVLERYRGAVAGAAVHDDVDSVAGEEVVLFNNIGGTVWRVQAIHRRERLGVGHDVGFHVVQVCHRVSMFGVLPAKFVQYGIQGGTDNFGGSPVLDAGGVVITLERGGYLGAAGFYELIHVAREITHRSAPQGHGNGLGRVSEIVNVAPVQRTRLASRDAFELFSKRGVPAGSRRAGHKDVEPVGVNAEAEIQGAHRPFLAYRGFQGSDFDGGPETEDAGVADGRQAFGGNSKTLYGHGLRSSAKDSIVNMSERLITTPPAWLSVP